MFLGNAILLIIITAIVSLIGKVLYDLIIIPNIMRSKIEKERKKAEDQDREEEEKEAMLRLLNAQWKSERKKLISAKKKLVQFNQINRFPDSYKALKCIQMASEIEEAIQDITLDEFQEIKVQLLEYSRRRNNINQNTGLKELINQFQKLLEPDKYEPLILRDKINDVLTLNKVPPFTEEDI